MRMHRGSSKGGRGRARPTESLPLSASPLLDVEFELVRAGRSEIRRLRVASGTPLRIALRSIGQAPEGSAVLCGDRPVPLDEPIDREGRFTVIPTFSGG